MAKLKVVGTWGGIIEVDLENWTLHMLRDEVAKRSGLDTELIKRRGARPEEGKSFKAEEERSHRLSRVKAAATALSKRHAYDSLPIEDYNIELEDQGGHKVEFGTKTDQSAAMMGLMLHTKAKSLIEKEMYSDAVEVLAMVEESFTLCDPKILEFVDNIPIMEIDIVWCHFLLWDLKCLSDAGVRLQKARKGLERAHGKDLSCLRLLQDGQCPELALYIRLELLEGVVAYHTGQYDKALSALKSAHAKFLQLQIPDETLSVVIGMGFKEKDSKRALRLNNQDISSSIDFLIEEKAKRVQKRKDNLKRQEGIREQKYGVTPMKKAVDMPMLDRLASIGYARDLAAECLRRNENDFQIALDALTNPKVNSRIIQAFFETRKRKRQEVVGISVDELVSMGFERIMATYALEAGGNREDIIQRLLSLTQANPRNGGATSSTNNAQESHGFDGQGSTSKWIDGRPDQDSDMKDETANRGSTSSNEEELDAEIEEEIADEIAQVDALSAYDINLDREIEAINEYLAMLDASDMPCSVYVWQKKESKANINHQKKTEGNRLGEKQASEENELIQTIDVVNR